MSKAEKTIEKDLFRIVKASNLAKMVSGKVYRKGMRPDGSQLEDIVVKFLAGLEGQIQNGVLVLNIYVPDITMVGSTELVEDTGRVEEIEQAAHDFIDSNPSTEYLYELDATPTSIAVEGISQHAVSVRIHYQRLNT